MKKQGYFIEFNGEFYQSVFPENEAENSQLHWELPDALKYMILECGIKEELITII